MPNSYFQFKQFTIHQDRCAMKVTTDACLFGAWVAQEVSRGKSFGKQPGNILDIGTGTGLLSLMLAQQCDAETDALEIDNDAFEQARENAARSPWKEKVTVIHGDANHFTFQRKYAVVISNPPFYENELRSGNEKKNTAHHGSDLTLNNLFSITRSRLADPGKFYFLLPFKRKKEAEKLVAAHSLFIHETVLVRPSARHDYFRVMIGGASDKSTQSRTKEISIRDEEQQYTPAFVRLLEDYYLYL